MLRVLLAKDLLRARRNPLPYLIHLAMPLVITGLLGVVFGLAFREEGDTGLGRIKLALVDEDDSVLTSLLRGAVHEGPSAEHLEVVLLDRTNALAQLTGKALSAAVIIPSGFTRAYLTGAGPVKLEVVKNPSQAIHPAVVEELMGVLVTGLNAVARNFHDELKTWGALLERPEGVDYRAVADRIVRTGDKFEAVRGYVDPPRISYQKESRPGPAPPSGAGMNLFAFLLPGLAGMFLLFLAEVSVRDVYREIRLHTFARFCTFPQSVGSFVTGKMVVSLVILLLGAFIMLGGGGLGFGLSWRAPVAMGAVAGAYALFSLGFMLLLAAFAQTERRADAVGNVTAMALGLMGGCAFPADSLPQFLREYVTPWMPPNWFVETLRALQFQNEAPWVWTVLKLAAAGVAFAVLAAWILERRLRKGVHA